MWKGRFSEETAEIVLNYTQSLDLDWCLAPFDIQGSIAHERMLVSVGLLSPDEGEKIEGGLRQVLQEIEEKSFIPSIELEDVHMNIEHRLTQLLGPLGAKLHTGRSRNDQIATTLRLYLRDRLQKVQQGMFTLLEAVLERAHAHRHIVVPGYTHLQQAQPVSMGHYWMSHFQAFRRDCIRLQAALDSLEDCPLGAGALAGSTLPLDRFYTAKELGFKNPTENSLDSVAHRDYLLDYHYFAAVFAIHCSRLAEDFIIYNSQEFGWLKLPDAFCTGSSMMPQKKNPDVLELTRGRTGQIIGHFVDLLVMLKGLPMTYNRDLQEDKRGLLASLAVILSIIEILPEFLSRVEVEEKRAVLGMENGMILATDVAEYLVKEGVPFRDAHWKAGQLVRYCLDNGRSLLDLTLSEWKAIIPEAKEDLLSILSLKESVARRQTYGGTGFICVDRQIEEGDGWLASQKKRDDACSSS
ncbi:argininosuccinate lyase [Aminobacterium sp. EBM-42]|uniref:argininosuccinate lyase n=1 Tax=Aminobacterium sp. EBM-42 TaxID=1918503 RepID=UPI000A4941D7|nr:argininosuccinate lyase [Aminobacterium sp. EBM-42]